MISRTLTACNSWTGVARSQLGRARDDSDVVELLLANPDQVEAVRQHVGGVHPQYVERFAGLLARAREQSEQ